MYAVTKAANAFWGSEVYNPKVNAKTAQEGYWKMGKKGLKMQYLTLRRVQKIKTISETVNTKVH